MSLISEYLHLDVEYLFSCKTCYYMRIYYIANEYSIKSIDIFCIEKSAYIYVEFIVLQCYYNFVKSPCYRSSLIYFHVFLTFVLSLFLELIVMESITNSLYIK